MASAILFGGAQLAPTLQNLASRIQILRAPYPSALVSCFLTNFPATSSEF